MIDRITIGTRKSRLANWQTDYICKLLKNNYPDLNIIKKEISTIGDEILDKPLVAIGDKGIFTKGLELQLLGGDIDIAVHSLKDLPTELPNGLVIAGYSPRHNPQDVLITKDKDINLDKMPSRPKIATGSLRRRAQWLNFKSDSILFDLRGNIETRIKKLDDSPELTGIILAAAGVERLEINNIYIHHLPISRMLPAVGQGVIAIETSEKNHMVHEMIESINNSESEIAVRAERQFLKYLGGGCHSPIAALGKIEFDKHGNKRLLLEGMLASADGNELHRSITIGDCKNPELLGSELAEELLKKCSVKIHNELKRIN